jgi:hypothetical protein
LLFCIEKDVEGTYGLNCWNVWHRVSRGRRGCPLLFGSWYVLHVVQANLALKNVEMHKGLMGTKLLRMNRVLGCVNANKAALSLAKSSNCRCAVEASWNVMAHAQKPDFVFRAKRTSPFKSARGGGSSFDYWQPRCAHQR